MPMAIDRRGRAWDNSGAFATNTLVATGDGTNVVAMRGKFNVAISGTWVGTVTIQCSYDNGIAWHDVAALTANGVTRYEEPEYGVLYRPSFNRTSGTAVVRISQ